MTAKQSRSEQLSSAFYRQLGDKGLAARTTPLWDGQILDQVRAMLRPGQRVLDLGCGYGRIAVPLARDLPVVGLDLSSTLLNAAGERARQRGAGLDLVRATMRAIPLASGSVDVVLCLWSAFNELLDRDEQLATVREVRRVLAVGGWALFEGPRYVPPTESEIASGQRYSDKFRLRRSEVAGLEVHGYHHDEASLRCLVKAAGISSYRIYTGPWAGRERLFLYFERMNQVEDTWIA